MPGKSKIIDKTTVEGKKSLKICVMNANVYAALCLLCNGAAFGCVTRAIMNDLPNGDGKLVWTNLCNKYEPKTQLSMVSLTKEFADWKLELVKIVLMTG
jgi:hypothetical protein